MATGIVTPETALTSPFVPEVFGRLTTLGPGYIVDFGTYKKKCHMVQCVCGTVKQVLRNNLTRGKVKSCGCLDMELKKSRSTHGHSRQGGTSPEFRAYHSMLKRCKNPKNKDYKDYGGRGIFVCPEWDCPDGFLVWFAHIGPRPSHEHSQDRKDNNKGYEPGNVYWATKEEQANNKRNNLWITHNGETKSISQWSKSTGIDRTTIKCRLNRGWEIVDALFVAPKPGNRKPKKP